MLRALGCFVVLGWATLHLADRGLEPEARVDEPFESIVGEAVMQADGLPLVPVSHATWEAASEREAVVRFYTEEAIWSSEPLTPGVGRLVAIGDAQVRLGEASSNDPDRLSIFGRRVNESRYEVSWAPDGRVLVLSGPYGDWYQHYTLELLLEPCGAGLELTAASCYMGSDIGNGWLRPTWLGAMVENTEQGCRVFFGMEVDEIPISFSGQVTVDAGERESGGERRRFRALERAQRIGPGPAAPGPGGGER